MKKVSIIIPVKEINDYIREAIPHYLAMDYQNFEILIFPDERTEEKFEKTTIIPSGKVGPAEKRDMALKYAEGEIFAFIDDDAYPDVNWLKNAIIYFEDSEIGAVGGPAVTAPEDNVWQKASGKIYESFLCSGGYTYRYLPRAKREVDDLPSVNLIVRRDVFEIIGGFDSNFYPGEDTKLCLDIIEKANKKIIYDPNILVYHHRRMVFKAHMKQITNYAMHRGYFAKKLPKTSCKPAYFVPTLFVTGLIIGPILGSVLPFLWYIYFAAIFLYVVLLLVSVKKSESFFEWLLTIVGIVATHVGYGVYFVKGLLSNKLIR